MESGVGPLLLNSFPGLEVHGRPHFTRHVVSLARVASLTSDALFAPSLSYRSLHPELRNHLEEQTALGIVVGCGLYPERSGDATVVSHNPVRVSDRRPRPD